MGQVKMGELEHAAWPGVQVRAVRDRGMDPSEVVGELAAERVRARIARERDAAFEAARYRAGEFLRRALEGGNGQV
jgi:hypothetical protein